MKKKNLNRWYHWKLGFYQEDHSITGMVVSAMHLKWKCCKALNYDPTDLTVQVTTLLDE